MPLNQIYFIISLHWTLLYEDSSGPNQ